MSKAGSRLIKAAHEARAIARGEMEPARLHPPADIDVRAIRQKLNMSQEEFARRFSCPVHQIRDWEQGRSRPLGFVRSYLALIDSEGDGVLRLIEKMRSRLAAA
jgi:putative transcriptional regulator